MPVPIAGPAGRSPEHRSEMAGPPGLLGQLSLVARQQGLDDLATHLRELWDWIADDLETFRSELGALPRAEPRVQRCANELLNLGGKHLRPLCVALSARAGRGFGEEARHLAVAVELVHNATLLHDDVVDLGLVRRGRATPRSIYGNATSIFAGDWLLVQALMRIRKAKVPGLLDFMLVIIDEMIQAESLQLENRGRVNARIDDYFRVVEGKTAALFRWAMFAGGRAGGLDEQTCRALERYGRHLGVAFQLVDDLLDVDGDAQVMGKALFTDLREGKMTYPILVALERDTDVHGAVDDCTRASEGMPLPESSLQRVLTALRATRALEVCRDLAQEHARLAIAELAALEDQRAATALITVARATTFRKH